jgi:curved DNA-binding protein CbpA
MTARDPAFDAYVLQIHGVLDRLDYYRLLGVDRGARIPEIKRAFFGIAARFHPDRNRDAVPAVGAAIYEIFKRLNEAYRVLCDHEKRKAYDAALAEGKTRLSTEDRRVAQPKTPEDSIQSREARQFYREAAAALEAGNLMQAELHIRVARSREGRDNEAINGLEGRVRAARAATVKK